MASRRSKPSFRSGSAHRALEAAMERDASQPLGLARNVGKLSVDLAQRYEAFVGVVSPLLPPQLAKRIKPLQGLSVFFRIGSRIEQIAEEQSISHGGAVDYLLGTLPSATNPLRGKVTSVLPWLPKNQSPEKSVPLREVLLVVGCQAMQEEAAMLDMVDFQASLPIIRGNKDRLIAVRDLGTVLAVTKEAFVGQPVTFEPMVPLLPSLNRDQTGP